MLSNLDIDADRALRQQKGLNIASGVAFGVAGGLFAAAVIDASRAGTQWQEILGREFSPEDIPDAEEATSKGSRAIAMLSAVPSMIGLGIGLRLGSNAKARIVPTTSGMAMVGRF